MADEVVQGGEQAQNQGQGEGSGAGTDEGKGQEQGRIHGNQRGWDGEYDETRARQLVDNLRNSERTLKEQRAADKARLDEQAAKLKEYEDAKLSDQERVTRDLTEKTEKLSAYEVRIRDLALRNEVLAEAGSLDIIDPRAAAKLLDAKAIIYDPETGEPTNVREQLEELLKVSPYLKRTGAGEGAAAKVEAPKTGAANPPRTDTSGKATFTEAQVRDFPFYMANKAAIMQAMYEGRIVKE